MKHYPEVDGNGLHTGVSETGFAERLLEVIDSGRRTATYKLALLLALLDLCIRRSDIDGDAPGELHTRDIAEEVAALYWRQIAPFARPGSDELITLRQISGSRASVVEAIRSLRELASSEGITSLHLARQRLPEAYELMVDLVEITIAEQPCLASKRWALRTRSSDSSMRSHGDRGRRSRSRSFVSTARGDPRFSSSRAPATSWSGSAHSFDRWSNCTGPEWLPASAELVGSKRPFIVTYSVRLGWSRPRPFGTQWPIGSPAGVSTVKVTRPKHRSSTTSSRWFEAASTWSKTWS